MGNGLHALMTHSDQLKHLVAQPELIANAVEELLRFESPLKLNTRIASVDMKIAGHFMPAGTFITCELHKHHFNFKMLNSF